MDAGDYIVELHATSNIDIDESSTVTEHPIASGGTISDNIYKNSSSVTLKGLLTKTFDIEKFTSDSTPDNIITKLRKFMTGERTANLYIDTEDGSGVDYYSNMVLTNMSRSRDKKTSNAWMVSLTFKQLLQATQLKRGSVDIVIETTVSTEFKNQAEKKVVGDSALTNKKLAFEIAKRIFY